MFIQRCNSPKRAKSLEKYENKSLVCIWIFVSTIVLMTDQSFSAEKVQKRHQKTGITHNNIEPLHPLDCSAYPDAVVCYKFTDQKSVDNLFPGNTDRGCKPGPQYDAIERAGKLTVASQCGANSSGCFRFDWSAIDDEMWIQFRFKPEKGLIKDASKYKIPSWKMMALWRGSVSCTDQGFVAHNGYYRGYPQFYEACGGYGYQLNVYGNDKKVITYDMQPGGDTQCFYSLRDRQIKPCFEFKEKWATYTFCFDLDGSNHEFRIPTVKGWAQYDGEERVQILEFPLRFVKYIEHGYFGPYMTRKDPTIAHPEWAVWYQDFLITKRPLINDQ